MFVVRALVAYLISAILLPPIYSIAILVYVFSQEASWKIIQAWDRTFLSLCGVSIDLEFEDENVDESRGGIIVSLNQESVIDPIIGRAVSHTIYKSIYNIEFALIPFVGWVSWLFGWVVVRQRPQQAIKQLDKAVDYLRNRGIVFISIEGRRTADRVLSPYKKGPVVLAIKAGCSLYPVISRGSDKCLPYGKWLIRPGIVHLKILREVSTRGMTYEDRDALVNQLREIAEQALGREEHQGRGE